METKVDYELVAINFAGVIGRAIIRAIKVDDYDSGIVEQQRILEFGRVEGARTSAACMAYLFKRKNERFDEARFFARIEIEAGKMVSAELNGRESNLFRVWFNGHAWDEYKAV